MAGKLDKCRERQKQEDTPTPGKGGGPVQDGREGRTLQRTIAGRDADKRSHERPAGRTRVRKRDKQAIG